MCLRQDPFRSIILVMSGFIAYFAFSFNYPSLKEEVDSKGVSQSWTGIILGVYSLPSFIFWLFFDKLVNRFGRKCMMLSGLYLFLVSFFLFGLIEFASVSFFFVLSGIITRFLLGVGSYQHKTVTYSVATKMFPNSIDKIFAYVSMGVNLGIGIGGFMGSLMYESMDQNLFYINALFAALLLAISAPLTHYLLSEPKSAASNQPQSKSITVKRVDTIAVEKTISFKYLVCDCKLAVHFIIPFWKVTQQNFWMTSLRKSLFQELNQSYTFIAMAYLIPGVCTFLMNPFAPCIIRKCRRPNTVIIGMTLNLIGYVFFGPLQFLPHEAYFVLVGAALEGFGYSLTYIPLLGQIIDTLLQKYPHFHIGPVTDKVSSLAYFSLDLGAIFGTVVGDLSYNAFGFRRMVLLFTFLHLFIMAMFIMFGRSGLPCRSQDSKLRIRHNSAEESTPSSGRKLQQQT